MWPFLLPNNFYNILKWHRLIQFLLMMNKNLILFEWKEL